MRKKIYVSIFSRFIAVLLCCSLRAYAETPVQTWLATPTGGPVFFRGKTVRSEELNTAIKKARAGDTVIILPGTYNQKLEIAKKASPDRPILITGIDDLTVFNCNQLPADEGKSPVTISGARGLVFRGLRFENCWPYAFNISDSDHIAVSGNSFISGKVPILITHRSSHHIIVEDNNWHQYPDDQLFKQSAKDFAAAPNLKNYVGAFVRAQSIAGDLIVRRNKVKSAFVGVELSQDKKTLPESTKNVRIYQNNFEDLTSSAITVDTSLANVWIHENKFQNVQSMFNSTAEVSSPLVVYANDLKNPSPSERTFIAITGGGATSSLKSYIFHNTVQCVSRALSFASKEESLFVASNKFDACGGTLAFDGVSEKTIQLIKNPENHLKPTTFSINIAGAKQTLVSSALGVEGLTSPPIYATMKVPYDDKVIPLRFAWEHNQVTLDLSAETRLKGLSTLTVAVDGGSPIASKPCTQSRNQIICPLPTPSSHKNLEAWLEVEEDTAIELWGSELTMLKLVRKPADKR